MSEGERSRDWEASVGVQFWMNVLGFGLVLVGLGLFGAIHGGGSVSLAGTEMLVGLVVTVALTFGLLVLHEYTHGLAVRGFGAAPTYGAMMMGKVMPVFYCTSVGHRFTRRQFLVILMAPLVLVSLICAVLILALPLSGWLVVPAAIHLGGCVGDLWMAVVVLREPGDTLVEDRKTGMRFYPAG